MTDFAIALLLSILAHLLGDYGLQNGWMAFGKLRRSLPAVVHGVSYGVAYVTTSYVFEWLGLWKEVAGLAQTAVYLRTPGLVLAIALTHLLVDRFAVASLWYRAYNGYLATPSDELEPWQRSVCLSIDQGIHRWCDTIFVILFWN